MGGLFKEMASHSSSGSAPLAPSDETVKPADLELIEAARDIIRKRYREDLHAVGSALRTKAGNIHLGVHLECYIGRVTVCAEAIAIGRAVVMGEGDSIETIVAVRQSSPQDTTPGVVTPCGMCREMISDFAPEARVLVPHGGSDDCVQVVSIGELLPMKYSREG